MSYVKSSFKEKQSSGFSHDLSYLFDWATKYPTNRLKNNYVNFNQDYLVASIIYNPDPIGFSLLQERPCFNGMARVLTRLFFPATYTGSLTVQNYKYSDGLRPEIYEMLDQQVEFGKRLGITDFFFSREDTKPLIMKNIHRGMIKNGYNWKIDTTKQYKVINNHYQWIIWLGENLLQPASV